MVDPDEVRKTARAAGDGMQETVDEMADAAHDTVSRASDTMSRAVGAATDAATKVIDSAREDVVAGTRQATELVGGVGDRAITTVKRHPARAVLIVAGCAMILGYLVGAATAARR